MEIRTGTKAGTGLIFLKIASDIGFEKRGIRKKRKLTVDMSSVFQRICLKNFLDGIQDIGR